MPESRGARSSLGLTPPGRPGLIPAVQSLLPWGTLRTCPSGWWHLSLLCLAH